MKKNYFVFVFLFLGLLSPKIFGQTIQITTGTAGTPISSVGPVMLTALGSFKASRYAYLYTQSELSTAGIPNGVSISEVGWMKSNAAPTTGAGILRIYMKNSAAADYSAASETWANLNAGTTLVYENLNQLIPGTTSPAYIPFTLNTPFIYTGGSLEISVEWDVTQVAGNPGTGELLWMWSTVPDRIFGASNTTLGALTTLSSTTSNTTITDRRPFIQLTYLPSAPCTNPPVAGTSVANHTIVCPNSPVALNVTGNSIGTGLTFEWESSPTLSPFVPTSLGAAASTTAFNINPTTSLYYRAKVVCNNGTPVYSTSVQVQVSGGLPANTYTINNGLPTAGLNYHSFADAIEAMDCGILGPVVFNVVPNSGPYVETVTIPEIMGANATNTITFKGNGNTVQFDNTATERQMLTFDGAKYVKIDSLTFKTLNSTYGWGALITNGSAYDSITNCVFDLSLTTSTASANTSGICFSSSNTAATTAGNNGSHCYIGGNRLLACTGSGGAYYALTLCGASDSNVVEHNLFRNFYFYGVYISGAAGSKILDNEIERATKTSTTTFYGIYSTGVTPGTLISGNRVHSPGGTTVGGTAISYCIYLLGDGTVADPCMVTNNAVYNITQGGAIYGIYLSTSPYTHVYHNTISIDQALTGTSANYGIYATGTNTGATIKNNIVSITSGTAGIKYGFYYSAAASVADAQRNAIYVNSSQAGVQNYGYYTTAYLNQAAFYAAYPTWEQGSLTANPQFTNIATGNLLPGNPTFSGNGLNLFTDVPFDIVRQLRAVLPTPGAYEIPSVQGPDAGLLALINPTAPFCAGQQPIQVSVMNSGTERLNSFQVHWTLNNVAQTPFSFTGILDTVNGTGQYIDTLTIGTITIPAGNNNIQAWIVLPSDVNDINDTITVSLTPSVFTLSSLLSSVCSGGDVTINLNPGAGYTPGTIAWQSSADGNLFSPISNATNTTYAATNLTASRFYRVFINSGANGCYSDTLAISVVSPAITSSTNGSRCGPGTVQLTATASSGSTINWFDTPLGGTPVGSGPTFTTTPLTTTTTYYAQAAVGGGIGSVGPLTPVSVGTNSGTAAAITTYHMAFDVLVPTTLVSVDIFPSGAAIGSNGIIVIQDNASTVVASVPYVTTVTGGATPQTITLNVPLAPGTGYKMGQLAPAISLIRNSAGAVYPYTSSAINIISNNFNAVSYYYFYNWQFTSGCEGPLEPVTATINTFPVVDLGTDIVTCTDGTVVQTLAAGNVAGATYVWDDNSSAPTRTVTASGAYYVAVSANGCTESDTINVTFNNNPTVNLGNDTAVCDGVTLVLDAQNTGATYVWDNLSTLSTRNVTTDGLYYVTVTDANNCVGSDSLSLSINEAPFVHLGNDTAICEGVVLTLDAGNPGVPTLWDNGWTNQTRTVADSGTYFVAVSAFGCITTDSIHISFNPRPDADAINATYSDSAIYVFYPLNAVHAQTYVWDFGDGSPTDTGYFVQHRYTDNGIYTVTLTVGGMCAGIEGTITRTVDVFDADGPTHLTDRAIGQSVHLYPNPASSTVTVASKDGVKMESVTVFNIAGQPIWSQKADAATLRIDVQTWTAGLYLIKIKTGQGMLIKKMEILK